MASSTGGDLATLLNELTHDISDFIPFHTTIGAGVTAEDYDGEIAALTGLVADLMARMRTLMYRCDDSAEAIDLKQIFHSPAVQAASAGTQLRLPRTLPTLHINRRRIEMLFISLFRDAARSKATHLKLTVDQRGRFTLSHDRPSRDGRTGATYFDLTYVDDDGVCHPNIDLFIARELIDFYAAKIAVSFTARSVEISFTLPVRSS